METMTNTTADWTDAEITRWMAERDDGLSPRPYAESLDSAVAWLGRRGLEWTRQVSLEAVHVSNGISWHTCAEDRFTTARALCNAGVAAEMAREAQG